MDRAVEAWADDVLADKDAALYAWRRANVDELNQRARGRMAEAGRLCGPELMAPGGRAYRAGDRVMTLAPGADGALVTSERAVVESVDAEHNGLVGEDDERQCWATIRSALGKVLRQPKDLDADERLTPGQWRAKDHRV